MEKHEQVAALHERLYGCRPSYTTVSRWIKVGIGGRKLKAYRILARYHTTESRMREFVEGEPVVARPAISDRVVDRLHADAMAELDRVLG